MGQLIGADQLFTFADLGFKDGGKARRRIGSTRPEVVLVVEKAALADIAWRIHRALGITVVVLGGLPSLQGTEFFVRALRSVIGTGSIHAISLVDFDPGGWIASTSFIKQLARFGMTTLGEPLYVVRPECFTAEELALFSIPIEPATPETAGKLQAWLQVSGGIGGEARSIGSEHLLPARRVEDRVAKLMAECSRGSNTAINNAPGLPLTEN